jgi:hypothetical protein
MVARSFFLAASISAAMAALGEAKAFGSVAEADVVPKVPQKARAAPKDIIRQS